MSPSEETSAGDTAVTVAHAPFNGPETIAVHPLVLPSVVDHYERVAKNSNRRVLGILLGSWQDGTLDVSNSFAGEAFPSCLRQTMSPKFVPDSSFTISVCSPSRSLRASIICLPCFVYTVHMHCADRNIRYTLYSAIERRRRNDFFFETVLTLKRSPSMSMPTSIVAQRCISVCSTI